LTERLVAHTFLRGGISIGNLLLGGAGTLGVSVFDNRTGQELILSNWHVLCESDTCRAGEPIIQPGAFDNGTQADLVAHLSPTASIMSLVSTDFTTRACEDFSTRSVTSRRDA
jgi:hypothetical protein